MNRASKFRVVFFSVLLLVAAIIVIAREHRPSFLRSGLRLYAYVSTADNSVSVVDLVKLATVAHVPVGGTISAMREHPSRAELWGVSSSGGFAWVLNSRTSQIVARIPVGALPYSIDFSADGNRVYVPASGSNSLVAIDCGSRQVIAHAVTGAQPVVARVSEDDRFVLVLNRKDSKAGIYDAGKLRLRIRVSVIHDTDNDVLQLDYVIAFIRGYTHRTL